MAETSGKAVLWHCANIPTADLCHVCVDIYTNNTINAQMNATF